MRLFLNNFCYCLIYDQLSFLVELFLRSVEIYLHRAGPLPANTTSIVTEASALHSLSKFLAAGQGSFETPQEADTFLRS